MICFGSLSRLMCQPISNQTNQMHAGPDAFQTP